MSCYYKNVYTVYMCMYISYMMVELKDTVCLPILYLTRHVCITIIIQYTYMLTSVGLTQLVLVTMYMYMCVINNIDYCGVWVNNQLFY